MEKPESEKLTPFHDIRVVSIHAGRVAPLGPAAVPSAYVKTRMADPIEVGPLGLAGDEQADLSVHGGLEQAVYAYPESHYALWGADFPAHAERFAAGSAGENLTLSGVDENTVCLGDTFRIGAGVLVQVTQPRQPCFKFALYFGDNHLPRAMVLNGRSGWYFRVLQPGPVSTGEPLTLAGRPNPTWSVARFNQVIAAKAATLAEWTEIAALPGLSSNWRNTAKAVLEGADHRYAVIA